MSCRKKHLAFISAAVLAGGFLASVPAADAVFASYKIRPVPAKGIISVEAKVQLQNRLPYIKDFDRIESVRWLIGKKELAVKPERLKDIVTFGGIPPSGEARVVYAIKVAPGFPKGAHPDHLPFVGGPDFIYVSAGLFLGLKGAEEGRVDVRWELPPGWTLGLGRSGLQTFRETQERFWVAGRMKHTTTLHIEGARLQLAIFNPSSGLNIARIEKSIASMFGYAWGHLGPLPDADFGLAVFPKGVLSLPGWTRSPCIVVDNVESATPHEILHLWMNNSAPAWFREGVLEYMSRKIMIQVGLLNEAALQGWLRAGLAARAGPAGRDDGLKSLADSSAEIDSGRGPGTDIYTLMPALAYKLDTEIQAYAPGRALDDVFFAVCRKRPDKVDIPAMIKDITGYDPQPLFARYLYAGIENSDDLLR